MNIYTVYLNLRQDASTSFDFEQVTPVAEGEERRWLYLIITCIIHVIHRL